MKEFDEIKLLAKGISEKQVSLAKIVSEIEGVEFIEAILTPLQFVHYEFAKDGTAYKTKSIDLRISKTENECIITNQEITPVYLKAIFCTIFNQHYSEKHFLNNVLLPKFSKKPFAYGVIKQDYHKHNYLEYIANEEKQLRHKKKYSLPKINPFIALFFSVQAIGDTTIEIYGD